MPVGTVARRIDVTEIRTGTVDGTSEESAKSRAAATGGAGIATRCHAMIERPDHFVAEDALSHARITEVLAAKLLVSRVTRSPAR